MDDDISTTHQIDKTVKVLAGVIGAVAVLVLLTQGVGPALGIVGLAALVIGGAAAVRGRARRVGIGSRRGAAGVLVSGFAVMVVGAAVSPSTPTVPAAEEAAAPTPTTASSTATSAPRPQPLVAVPTTTPPPALPPAPVLAMTCPAGGTVASPVYGQQITAAAPFTVTISYGDGDQYTNDDQNLAAVFSHTYLTPGSYLVQAVVTDVAGQTTTAECTYSWTAPAPPAPAPVASSGGSSSEGGGASQGGSSPVAGGGAHYENCTEVRAAGAAPIYSGDPGFQQKFDRDGDGVGCES